MELIFEQSLIGHPLLPLRNILTNTWMNNLTMLINLVSFLADTSSCPRIAAAGERSKEGLLQISMPPYFTRCVIAIVPRCHHFSWESQSLTFHDMMGGI
eukprot:238969-Ditylum_brightwellii.AAC.1